MSVWACLCIPVLDLAVVYVSLEALECDTVSGTPVHPCEAPGR